MNRILLLLLAFLTLAGCRTKSVSISKEKHTEKEITKSKKDSILQVKNEVKTTLFSFENQQSFEMEIISDKDKDSIIVEKIRSPTSEKIIVRGGKLYLKTTHHSADKITKKDTLQVNNTSVRTSIEEQKNAEKQIFKKEKEVENKGFSVWFWLWGILILILLFLAWRLKFFRSLSLFK